MLTSPIVLFSILLIVVIFAVERRWPNMVAGIEENAIALLLAAITLISFVQVVLRYGFNTSINGALELTTVLFAWLILFGMSYGVKTGMHLGVDAFIHLLPKPAFRVVAIFGALCCLAWAIILLNADWMQFLGAKTRGGAIDYWSKMYKLNIGMEDMRYPGLLTEMLDLPERTQRWVAYLMLPIGLALFAFRSLEAVIEVIRGKRELIIAGHEAEELVAESKGVLAD